MPLRDPSQFNLYTDAAMARAELHRLAGGEVAVFSTPAPTGADGSANEDAAALLPFDEQRGVLALADGMGGPPGGEHASAIALEAVLGSLREAIAFHIDLREAILNAFETANRRLLETSSGSGTTLAVVELDGRSIRPYHAGDSMILITGQRGRVRFQSISHSPVGYAVEAGVLDEAAAIQHEDRHIVSNVVGSAEMRIDVGPALALNRRDTVLLGSDGVFDNLHVDEVVQIVRQGPLARAAETLAELSLRRMQEPRDGRPSKPDDLTFILYRPSQ